jgi:hypothetical protein
MNSSLSRRQFLNLGALSAALPLGFGHQWSGWRYKRSDKDHGLGRLAVSQLPVRDRPSFSGEILRWERRDHLFRLRETLIDPESPSHNQKWYRLSNGFVYSGYVQPVDIRMNTPANYVSANGQLVEITVPYTRSFQVFKSGWQPLYQLCFGSVHWATALVVGPKGSIWYQIIDDRLRIPYVIPAEHARIISSAELAPVSPHVPADQKHIEVSISAQSLTAFEFGEPIFKTTVSTGVHQESVPEGEIPTDTPTGNHLVDHKRPVRHMGLGDITAEPEAYELPGVPWVSYFYSLTGVAFHGTYWHNNFGKPLSHGCVNMKSNEAKWLYRWTMPHHHATEWYTRDRGTTVRVI